MAAKTQPPVKSPPSMSSHFRTGRRLEHSQLQLQVIRSSRRVKHSANKTRWSNDGDRHHARCDVAHLLPALLLAVRRAAAADRRDIFCSTERPWAAGAEC